jgi:hypothetical protein
MKNRPPLVRSPICRRTAVPLQNSHDEAVLRRAVGNFGSVDDVGPRRQVMVSRQAAVNEGV